MVKCKKQTLLSLNRYDLCQKIMLAFLLPLAKRIVVDAIARIPENEELGEKLVELCLLILKKAVALTKTEMDDELLAVVEKAILAREEEPEDLETNNG